VNALGRHLLVELHGCEPSTLDDLQTITDMMVNTASIMCMTILDVRSRKFDPQGVTAIVMIAESHLSIHTWPEFGYAAVDIFTCNGEIPDQVVSRISETLQASQVHAMEVKRGIIGSREREIVSLAGRAR
jgi:S-adenosylmethionine decarboxylase